MHQYSQRQAEVIDTADHKLKKLRLKEIEPKLPDYLLTNLLDRDYEAEQRLREMGRREPVRFIS